MTCECIGIYFSGCIYGEILTNYIDFMFLGCAPVAGFFLAVGSVHRGAAARALTGGMALASTDVAEPQDRKGSPPESCGASATRKLPGLMGSASLAHVGTRVPFSPTPSGSRNCHCWGLGVCLARRTCTAAPHPATQPATPAKAQRKGWGRGASGGQKRSGLASLPARRPHRGRRCVVSLAHCFGPGDRRLRPVRSAPPAARAVEAADRMKTSR